MPKRHGDGRALLNAPMREGHEGDVDIQDVRKPVFQTLLYFTYTDQLPEVLPCSCYAAQVTLAPPCLLTYVAWFHQAHLLSEVKYSSIG